MDKQVRPISVTIIACLIIAAGCQIPLLWVAGHMGPQFSAFWPTIDWHAALLPAVKIPPAPGLVEKLVYGLFLCAQGYIQSPLLWVILTGPVLLVSGIMMLRGLNWARLLYLWSWPIGALYSGLIWGFCPKSLAVLTAYLALVVAGIVINALLTSPIPAAYFNARPSNILPIAYRETVSYFYSPIAYWVLAVFLFISGFLYCAGLLEGQANMRGIFYTMGFILLLLSPAITMRMMSEEMKMGTLEPMMTAPVTDTEVVLGKFLSGIGFYAFLLLPTVGYAVMLSRVGDLDWGPVWSSYLGLVLMGCVYISVGLLISCLTKDQVTAAVAGISVLLVLWLMDYITKRATDWLSESVRYVTLFYHLDTFVKGSIDTRDIIFYLSLTLFLLFLSVRVVEARKWK